MPGGLVPSTSFQRDLDIQLNFWASKFGSTFILGLSGGGDSMALALGCARWVASGNGRVHAVCVDHGLRPDAAHEARQTVTWAQDLGLSAQMVSLNLEPTHARLQERARAGRHIALSAIAKERGSRVILLAHTCDDQNETLALRLASKTGLNGLAGMATLSPSPFYDASWPCLIGRPLLGLSRRDLRDVLSQARQNWHEDPSNNSTAFARIRARARLAALSASGSDVSALGRIATHAATLRHALDISARAFLARADMTITDAHTSLSHQALLGANACVVERALAWLAFSVGNAVRLPQALKTARLHQALTAPHFKGATLGGARFYLQGNRLIVAAAPVRRHQNRVITPNSRSIALRLAAISANLDQFVTHLG